MQTKSPVPKSSETQDWDSPDYEIPPFVRYPADGTREATEMMIESIDVKVAKLAKLGLRPHPTMLEYRSELLEQLTNKGPYRLRMSGGIF